MNVDFAFLPAGRSTGGRPVLHPSLVEKDPHAARSGRADFRLLEAYGKITALKKEIEILKDALAKSDKTIAELRDKMVIVHMGEDAFAPVEGMADVQEEVARSDSPRVDSPKLRKRRSKKQKQEARSPSDDSFDPDGL